MASQDRSGSPFVTATFQHVLNTEIARVMLAIDSGQYEQAYSCEKTLIQAMNPKHTKDLIQNDLKHVDDLILKAKRQKTVDTYQTQRIQKSSVRRITKRYVRDIFGKIMAILHEKGYLEQDRGRIGRPDFDKLEKETLEDKMDKGQP